MFSANRLPAKYVFRPKNGPVPSQPVNAYAKRAFSPKNGPVPRTCPARHGQGGSDFEPRQGQALRRTSPWEETTFDAYSARFVPDASGRGRGGMRPSNRQPAQLAVHPTDEIQIGPQLNPDRNVPMFAADQHALRGGSWFVAHGIRPRALIPCYGNRRKMVRAVQINLGANKKPGEDLFSTPGVKVRESILTELMQL